MKKIKITPEMARDLLHNLDPKIPEHMQIYETTLYYYLVGKEGFERDAYDDARPIGQNKVKNLNNIVGNITVGIGFNMDTEESRKIWNTFFKGNVNFDTVYSGKQGLKENEINGLLEFVLDSKRKEFKYIYKDIINKLRLNERFALEDLYFNGPNLLRPDTSFFKYMHKYYETDDKKYLALAVNEVKSRSNRDKNKGIQARRDAQAEILDSTKAPFYSSPHSPLLPIKSIKAKLGDTVIPRGTENWDKPKHSEYFIWRTQCDQKVRESHLLLEGQIFTNDFKPALGGPGEDYNCRCTKEILPTNIEVIRDEKEPISKKYFDINLELFGIELHNLREEIHEFLVKKRSEDKTQLT